MKYKCSRKKGQRQANFLISSLKSRTINHSLYIDESHHWIFFYFIYLWNSKAWLKLFMCWGRGKGSLLCGFLMPGEGWACHTMFSSELFLVLLNYPSYHRGEAPAFKRFKASQSSHIWLKSASGGCLWRGQTKLPVFPKGILIEALFTLWSGSFCRYLPQHLRDLILYP